MSSSSSSSTSVSGEKRKLEIVEEKVDLPPVGTHHNGNFHVYFSHKIQKLEELHKRAPEEVISKVFHQCCVHVNGATSPPLQDIRRLVTLHGGEFAAYKTSRVTHIVCEYLTDAQLKQEMGKVKLQSMANQRNFCFVQAKWVTDSVSKGKRQPEADYLPRGLKGRFGSDLKSLMTSSRATNNLQTSLTENSDKPTVESPLTTTLDRSDEIDLLSPPEVCSKDNESQSDEVHCLLPSSHDDSHNIASKGWSLLSEEQREFLSAIPEQLRGELLQQLLADNNATTSTSSGQQITTRSSRTSEDDFIELVSVHNSPAMGSTKTSHPSLSITALDDDIIDLATPDPERTGHTNREKGHSIETTAEGADIWGDEQLLNTLREAIHFIHFTAGDRPLRQNQTQKLKLWVETVLENATSPHDSVTDGDSGSVHDEDSLHWHLQRSWRLLTFYAEWLLSQNLFSMWHWMSRLLESHMTCQWSDDDEHEGAWKRIFMPNRFHRQEYLRWKQRSMQLLASRNCHV